MSAEESRDQLIKDLLEETERYKEALEYYANERLYFPRSILRVCNDKGLRLAPIYSDFGEVAQEALKGVK